MKESCRCIARRPCPMLPYNAAAEIRSKWRLSVTGPVHRGKPGMQIHPVFHACGRQEFELWTRQCKKQARGQPSLISFCANIQAKPREGLLIASKLFKPTYCDDIFPQQGKGF